MGVRIAVTCALALALCACGGPKVRQERYTHRGQDYLASGNYLKALVEFRNALQIDPSNADLRYDIALTDEKLGNVREAAGFYAGAIEANHDHVAARAGLGRLLVFSGLPDEALKQIQPGLDAHPDDVALLIIRATALKQKKDTPTALQLAKKAVSLDPNNEDALATLAGIEVESGQKDEAVKLVEEATKRLPQSAVLRQLLAQVYLDRGDTANAERVLLALIQLQPKELIYRSRLALVYIADNRLDDAERTLRAAITAAPADIQAKKDLADFLWNRRGHAVAETELERMITQDPQDIELRFTLAGLYEKGGDTAKAEAQDRAMIESERWSSAGVRAREHLAAVYAARRDLPAADRVIKEILSHNPTDNAALALRASGELARGKAQAAIIDLRQVLRDQPESIVLLNALANAYLADGEPRLAEDTARHAVELDPSSEPARIELVQVLVATGKFAQAQTVLAELHKQVPNDLTALDLLYRCDIALGDLDGAQTAASELVRLQPDVAQGRLYLGIVAESSHRANDALAEYQRALELAPRSPEPLDAMAALLLKLKRFDEANQLVEAAVRRDPSSAVVQNIKGEVLFAQGPDHLSAADAAFRAALSQAPKWWNPYRGLAYVALRRNDLNGTEAILQQAASQADLGEGQRLELAGLMTRANQPEEAIKQYDAVMKADPRSQIAAGGLAMMLVSYRSDQASIDRAATLVQPLAASNDWQLLDAFGWVQYKKQDFKTALTALQKAAVQRPDAMQLRFHLGMAELKSGRADQAEKDLAAALAHNQMFVGSDEAKTALAQLRGHKS